MHTYTDYLQFLQELCQTLHRLAELAGKKVEAVRGRDLAALQTCMNQEQALSLTLRGQEHKRLAILQDLGLGDIPLRETPRRCPPEQRRAVSDAVERTLRAWQVLKSAQEPARLLLESRLRLIEGELQRRGLEDELSAPSPAGGRQSPHRTDIKI